MSRPQFSKDYRTYGEWLKAMPRTSRYAREIIRKHQLFPDKSLNRLRKMRISDVSATHKAFTSLNPYEKDVRKRSLMVLSEMRKGKSLTEASKEHGVKVQSVLKHLGTSVKKKNGKWVPSKTDHIERSRWFYSDAKRVAVIVNSSKDASLISKYLNAVRVALNTGNDTILEPFKYLKIKGADGKDYPFETDLEKLYELNEQIEDSEFLPIYDDRN
ncbi:hypothetical protein HNV12_22580 [Methanococcoides sp. SA1]|nr:hypothetical protein [Methanococcoides sp. SA1]